MAFSDTREGRDIARLLGSFDADVARLRKAMAAEICACGHEAEAHDGGIGICDDCDCNAFRPAAADLTSRLAAWLEADGITSGDTAAHVAGSLMESPAMRSAVDELFSGGTAPQMLRDAATGIADLHALGDAGWAAENYWHGHGTRRPK